MDRVPVGRNRRALAKMVLDVPHTITIQLITADAPSSLPIPGSMSLHLQHRRILLLVGLGALALGCDRSARAANATADSSRPAYLDPAEGCEFLRASLNPNPRALVDEYVRRDSEGQFLETNRWVDTAYTCPGHLPGPDEFTAVSRTTVTELDRTDSLVRFLSRSDQLGEMTQDSLGYIFKANRQATIDTFVVVRTPFGWRIESPQLPDRVSVQWILSHAAQLGVHGRSVDSLRRAARPGA